MFDLFVKMGLPFAHNDLVSGNIPDYRDDTDKNGKTTFIK